MKTRRVAVCIALLSFGTLGIAQADDRTKYCRIVRSDGVVCVTIENPSDSPGKIACSGRVFGATKSGHVVKQLMKGVEIEPGKYSQVMVYSESHKDPFVRGWSDIVCNPVAPPAPPPEDPALDE